jgi:hypothetical protein
MNTAIQIHTHTHTSSRRSISIQIGLYVSFRHTCLLNKISIAHSRTQKHKQNISISSIVIHVHAHAAKSHIALILLHGWTGPASERVRGIIREGSRVVIVSIPKRQVGTVAITGGSENSRPLTGRSINTTLVTGAAACINKGLVPSTVVSGRSSPILRSFNVKPHRTTPSRVTVRAQIRGQCFQLRGGRSRACGTREHTVFN